MLFFAWLSLFLKGALRPLTQKGGASTFLIFILHLDIWLLKCCCEGMPAAMTTGHWGWSRACCLHHCAPSLDLQSRQEFLTCAVVDMVFLGSEGFLFFHVLHNVSLFILPCCVTVQAGGVAARGHCSVTGRCMMCVLHGRAVHTEMESVGCSVETPFPEKMWPHIFMGVVGEEQTRRVLCWFQLVCCGNCSWIEPFESCVMWEKVSALVKH